jgi:hypothetical protein
MFALGWTVDSRTLVFRAYRDGHWKAFKQNLDEDVAEPIATGTERDLLG